VTESTSTPVGKRRLPWPIVTALLAVLVVAVVVLLAGRRRPTSSKDRPLIAVALVKEAQGPVEVLRGAERRKLASGDTAYVDDVITTEEAGALSLTTYPGSVELSLGGETTLAFDGPAELRVDRGRVRAHVPDSVVHVFITPHGRVLARETRLSLQVGAQGTEIEVSEGDARAEGPRGLRQVVPAGARMFLSAQPAWARD